MLHTGDCAMNGAGATRGPCWQGSFRYNLLVLDIRKPVSVMKKDIHPKYEETTVTCGCGNKFKTRSTRKNIAVEICSVCHPFFTGKMKYVDTAGRVEKFQRKWGKKKEEAAAPAN